MRVKSVKHVTLVEPVPVYDLSICEETPCFSLGAGIVSHNTTPWGTELMDLRKSRYDDGLCCHYDYSANEMRVIACVAGETSLLKAFEDGKDIHRFIASSVWRKPESEVTTAERRFAKIVSFSILYGKGVHSLAADNFAGDVPRAQKLFDDFYGQFPRIRDFIHARHAEALETGRVKTMFGNELIVGMPEEALRLPKEVKDRIVFGKEGVFDSSIVFDSDRRKNQKIKSMAGSALRNAQNWSIQSPASSVAGMSMGRMSSEFSRRQYESRLTMFTHDAGDIDTRMRHLPEVLSMLPEYSIKWPRDRFGLVLNIEYEIGVSCDQLVALEHTVIDGKLINSEFAGKQKSVDLLIDRLTKYNVKVNVDVHDRETKRQSLSELFIARRGFALSMGSSYELIKGNITMDFSDVQ